MIKTIKTDLTFEEELLVAVYYNNVEKLKWLIGMEYFKPSMIFEPIEIGKVSVPLICTFTFDSGGDELYYGGFTHLDRRSRTSSQKKRIESACI